MTKRENFEAILNIEAVAVNENLVNFINHEIELLDNRKNTSSKAKVKKDAEKAERRREFADALWREFEAMPEGVTYSTIKATFPDISAVELSHSIKNDDRFAIEKKGGKNIYKVVKR